MRSFFLVPVVLSILFGIPWVASQFRAAPHTAAAPEPVAASSPRESGPIAATPPALRLPDPVLAEDFAALRLVPVSLPLLGTSFAAASDVAPKLPANEAELNSAIQKELVRLGY